jgi:hypothetical protein
MTTSGQGLTTRHISNSEVGTWNTCQRQYYYSFDLSLEPKRHSAPLSRGILGHDAIAAYYLAIKAGKSPGDAALEARQILRMAMNDTISFDMEVVMDVDRILNAYFPMTVKDLSDWEILEVESKHDLPMTDDFDMPLRLDLLVRIRSTKEIVLIDHKYTYDFWTEDDLALNPQFPKYVGALRNSDYPIAYCILNQIRTRHLKNPGADDLVRRSIQRPSNAKIRRALTEHIIASQQIAEFRSLAPETRAQVATRVLNKMVCRGCFVKSLCQAEFDGGDIQYLAQNDYKARTYGYNDTPNIEELL